MATEIRTEAEIKTGISPETIDPAFMPGDPRRYGAKADGATDDTAAIVAANTVRDASGKPRVG